MKRDIPSGHPIRGFFSATLHDALYGRLGLQEPDVECYLATMLVEFLRIDSVYAIKDKTGRAVTTVTEMVEEGDVRLKADSFAREREVHRHIGDFLLFWSGLFPENLRSIKSPAGKDALLDPVGQGRMSYYVASSFDHDPYREESQTLKKLSEGFEHYRYGLSLVRNSLSQASW